MKIELDLDDDYVKELKYMITLLRRTESPLKLESIEELIEYVVGRVIEGSMRPGSWERELLDMMGLSADCPEHKVFRTEYGKPE